MFAYCYLSLLCVVLAAASHQHPKQGNVQPEDSPPRIEDNSLFDRAYELLTISNNKFSADMLAEAVKHHSDTFVISAYSAFSSLSLLTLAAEGQTRKELLKALDFVDSDDDPDYTENMLRAANVVANTLVARAKGIQIKTASRIYVPSSAAINSYFETITIAGVGTDLHQINYSPQAVVDINSWVSNQTNNKIVNFLGPRDIDMFSQFILVDALYFMGQWETPFDSKNTNYETFYATAANSTDIDASMLAEILFMTQQGTFGYNRNDRLNAKILEMRFADKLTDASFVMILPNSPNGLNSLLDLIKDPIVLRQALKSLSPTMVQISIPKFKIETETDLKEILQKNGVRKVFEPSAELPNMYNHSIDWYRSHKSRREIPATTKVNIEPNITNDIESMLRKRSANKKSVSWPTNFYVTKAIQKAYISVYESGTEDAGATVAADVVGDEMLELIKAVTSQLTDKKLVNDDDHALQLIMTANDQLSDKMLMEAVKSHSESLVLSTFSVFTPLCLLSLIAEGPTHTELLHTLGFQTDLSLVRAMTVENSYLHTEEGIEMKTANRIYLPYDIDLNEEFVIGTDIITELKDFDYRKPKQAVANINNWVAVQTDDKIEDVLSLGDIDKKTRMILIDAIYFKGRWDKSFDKAITKYGTFYVTETKQTEVNFMFQGDHFGYSKNDKLNAQILEMPYASNVASMVIILPNEINGLDALLEKIKDPLILRKAITKLPVKTVGVIIPKFEIETTLNLQENLQNIGIKTVFSPEANLSKLLNRSNFATSTEFNSINNTILPDSNVVVQNPMSINYSTGTKYFTNINGYTGTNDSTGTNHSTSANLFVSKAVQKSIISIDEAGTKHVTASATTLPDKDVSMKYILEFKADHPFIFLIKQEDLIILAGVYKS